MRSPDTKADVERHNRRLSDALTACKAERARIVEALAAIHHRDKCAQCTMTYDTCAGCGDIVDSDGDCPTMRIAKGKP